MFGLSVMTHLTADAQAAWLAELARIMRPGGLALITFSGAAAVSYSARWRDTAWWRSWMERGFDDGQADPALGSAIADPSYYRNTYQSAADVRRRWTGAFDILDILPERFGYQDVAVMRRR